MRFITMSMAALFAIVVPTSAYADYDTTSAALITDAFQQIDHNGVDVTSGFYHTAAPGIVAGSDENNFTFSLEWTGQSWQPSIPSIWQDDDGSVYVSDGTQVDEFDLKSGLWVSAKTNGATLQCSTWDENHSHIRNCIYRSHDGHFATFNTESPNFGTVFTIGMGNLGADNGQSSRGGGTSMSYQTQGGGVEIETYNGFGIIMDVTVANAGIRLYTVSANSNGTFTGLYAPTQGVLLKQILINTPNLDGSHDYDSNVLRPKSVTQTFTDPDGHVWSYVFDSDHNMTGVRTPSNSANSITITYDDKHRVSYYTNAYGTWHYTYSTSGSTGTTIVTDPAGKQKTITYIKKKGYARSVTDELGHTTTYAYDDGNQLKTITYPLLNHVDYGYDTCGNVTSLTRSPPPTSTEPVIAESATYDTGCGANFGKPLSVTDGRHLETDFTYDSAGELQSITLPVNSSGIHPRTTYTRNWMVPTIRLANGSLYTGTALTGAYVVTSVSACRTQATCAGTVDEIRTDYNYGVTDGSQENYIYARSITRGAGNASLQAVEARTYDQIGNILTSDGPLPGVADTTRYKYDAERKQIAVMTPHPDVAGTLPVRATRTTYNGEGQPTLVEDGYATDQTDPSLNAMTVIRQTATAYDPAMQKLSDAVSAAGTILTLTQYSYDSLGRLSCTAVRMNPAIFTTPPASACALGTQGSFGSDRITRILYTDVSQVYQTQKAYLTSLAINDTTNTYNANGKLATVADAKGNITTYGYDGFDRLAKTSYPTPGNGTVPSTTDYEGITYDANSNITQRRERDGNLINYTYDNLNRQTLIDLPNSSGAINPDVSYTYDNQNKVLSATDTAGGSVVYTYDDLGRTLSEKEGTRTLLSVYDLADRRTKLTWADSFYTTYDYYLTGEMTAIHENGAAATVTFGYDNFGRRTGMTRSNGVATTYGYDPLSRLTTLSQDLAATQYDVTYNLTYNPASQVGTHETTNGTYVYAQASNLSTGYTSNALNQYSQTTGSSAATITYDGRGNLSNRGGALYTYDARNLLISATAGSSSFTYDPTSRMRTITAEGVTLDYDGPNLVAEYDASGNLLHRYIHGPGTDEPVIWYDHGVKKWLLANYQGSVIAATLATGAPASTNSYGEWGNPATTNQGRFQYTGQAWIGGVALYNYKARLYSPDLGRFMQTDPTGYKDGINWYAYAGNDPIGKSDATGKSWFSDFIGDIRQIPSDIGDALSHLKQGDISYVASDIPDFGASISAVSQIDMAAGRTIASLQSEGKAAEGVEGTGTALTSYFPANNGFLGASSETTLEAGQTIDRYGGSAYSQFFSPQGVPAEMRALPPGVAEQGLRTFQVTQPFSVESGTVAPAFGQFGLGTQYRSSMTLGELLEQGYLSETTP